ncbi:unnamed protein product, partial [Effrenium voratum]
MEVAFEDVAGLLRDSLPLGFALAAAVWGAKLLSRPKPLKSDHRLKATSRPKSREMKLCSPDVPTLTFFGDQLQLFDKEVRRIYAVDHEKPPLGPGCMGNKDFVPPCEVIESVRQLRAACADLQEPATGWRKHEPLDDPLFARTLLAADFNHTRSVQLVRQYAHFRQEVHGGIPPDLSWLKEGIAVIPFEDVMGRPVFLARAKFFDGAITAESFRQVYRGLVDSVIAHLLQKRQAKMNDSNPLEQYVLVLDVMGASRQNFSMTSVKVMIEESNNRYPDRVAQIFVLGVNLAVRSLWSIISPMVHPRTRKKVQLISSEQVPCLMRRLVDPARLPQEYGGSAPNLTAPADAKNLTEMAGALAVAAWDNLGAVKMFEEKNALTKRVCVAWQPDAFSSFKLWLQSRGEGTAVTRSAAECADFLTDLQRSESSVSLDLPHEQGCWGGGSWLSICMSPR